MLRNIVIDLDMLLDTRAGTLRRIIGEEKANEIINSEAYRLRDHEKLWELAGIDKDTWDAGWELRDEVTLSRSLPTLVMADMPRFLTDLNNVVAGNNPGISDARFLINTYPYKLSKEVKAKIATACQFNFSTACDVETISLDYSRLSPVQCKDRNIILLFVYDIMKYNQTCFPDDVKWSMDNLPTPNEELVVITPRINRDCFSKRDEITDMGVELPHGITDFEISMELIRLIYGLEFVNSSYACEVTEEVLERIRKGYDRAANFNPTKEPGEIDLSVYGDPNEEDPDAEVELEIPKPNFNKRK